jgi:transposase
MLHRWQAAVSAGPANAFAGMGQRRREEGRVAELECKIRQQALEIDFLKECLQRIDEQRELRAVTGKSLSVSSSALGPTAGGV